MSTALRSALSALGLAAGLATPRIAEACAVCMGGVGGGKQSAFAIGSLFLSVVPLAALATGIWYVRRRAKAIERETNERRERPEHREVHAPGASLSSNG